MSGVLARPCVKTPYSLHLMKIFLNLFLLTLMLLGAASCTDKSTTPTPTGPQAGYVTGHVVDAQGNPIKGAEIVVNNTGGVIQNLFGSTDANGDYRIKLADGPLVGNYYVRGHVKVAYQGQTCSLILLTENDQPFAPTDSPVRNMHLTLTGNRSDNFSDTGYFGATLEVDNHSNNAHFPNIEVTLEPIGPLVDGSVGKKVIAQPNWLYSYNIPVGKYKITARDVATNKALTVKNYLYDSSFQQSTTGLFEAIQTGGDRYQLIIVVAD